MLLSRGGRDPWPAAPLDPRRALRAALASPDEDKLLAKVDDELRTDAAVVPLAWVADARLVSPRLAAGARTARLGRLRAGQSPGVEPTPVMLKRAVAIAGTSARSGSARRSSRSALTSGASRVSPGTSAASPARRP